MNTSTWPRPEAFVVSVILKCICLSCDILLMLAKLLVFLEETSNNLFLCVNLQHRKLKNFHYESSY